MGVLDRFLGRGGEQPVEISLYASDGINFPLSDRPFNSPFTLVDSIVVQIERREPYDATTYFFNPILNRFLKNGLRNGFYDSNTQPYLSVRFPSLEEYHKFIAYWFVTELVFGPDGPIGLRNDKTMAESTGRALILYAKEHPEYVTHLDTGFVDEVQRASISHGSDSS